MLDLNQFVTELQKLEQLDVTHDILNLLPLFEKFDSTRWRKLMHIKDGELCTTTLYHSEQFKLILISWQGQQESSVHGHPGGGGLIKVLEGSLLETRYDPDDAHLAIDNHPITLSQIRYIHDVLAHHKVSNPNNTPSVSLHLYCVRPETVVPSVRA